MRIRTPGHRWVAALLATFALGAWADVAVRADDVDSPRAVYTLSNEAGGNQLIVLRRAHDGTLSLAGQVATGGSGTGAGLGSQGAIILAGNRRALYAVNAGSNNISVIKLRKGGPRVTQIIDSAGIQPISLTARKDTLYVLNNGSAAGSADQVTGFRIDDDSQELSLLPGSTRGLSATAVGPAQVGFDSMGSVLVVTEKTTNNIDTFLIDSNGYASGMLAQSSSGIEPFGFAFNRWGFLIVSEAFGGAAGASTVSSYRVDPGTGILSVLSPSVPTEQTAACWISVTKNGRYAYASNTGSGTVTGFRVHDDGTLARLVDSGVSGVTGGAAIDSAIVGNRFLYVLSGGHAGGESQVTAFEIADDGSLDLIGSIGGLPASTVGLAAE